MPSSVLASQTKPRPSKAKLAYDIFMLFAIVLDLLLMMADLILMSNFCQHIAQWLDIGSTYHYYTDVIHPNLRLAGGFFTLFLFSELLVRWIISIQKKEYLRWFFFPFVHWYEVLGCFPQLRALRLLRAGVIVHRLHQLGHQVIPQRWIDTGKFYYDVIFEEIADRVILTATAHIRQQFLSNNQANNVINTVVEKNRDAIIHAIADLLQQNLAHNATFTDELSKTLSNQVGAIIQQSIRDTPELSRYVGLIPIVGHKIEAQIQTIGQRVGENTVTAITEQLTRPDTVHTLSQSLASALANVKVNTPELEALILNIIDESLTAFEQQVKVQQWKHHDQLHLHL
ncbi:hypothetical protein [Psychrobacter sp. I-STPA6b]|uniref:hypothetical protein n=1 Tax=Psychrobacter sp. I-STPA6b TaxID=2585718 RepID=UPI001D0C6138|nr:hypothetical protein [Psychrobacter sp. I-STPA6b]